MITILQNGSGIKFTFDSNDHYLQDGEIEVPVNSLSLIMDDSEMFTFVKSQSNDIFLSARYNDVNGGMTREQLEAFFKNNMVASNLGSSISEIYVGTSADTVDANTGVVTKYDGDKQWLNIVYQDQQGYYSMTKINLNEFIIEGETGSGVTTNADGVIIGKVDPRSEEVYTAYDISGNPSTSASVLSVNESGFTVDNIQSAIDGKTLIDRRLYTPKEGVYDNTTQRITFKSDLNDSLFEVQLSADTITIDPTLDSGSTNAVANSAITIAIDEIDSVTSAALNDLNVRIIDVESAVSSAITSSEVQTMIDESVSGKADTSAVTESINAAVSGKVDTSTYNTYTAATATEIGNKLATSDFNTYSGTVNTAINSKASQSDLSTLSGTVTAHTANTDIHVTTAQTAAWNAKSDFSGSYNDLTDKPTLFSGSYNDLTDKPTIPSKTSDLTNDSNFATSAYVDTKLSISDFNTYSGTVNTAIGNKANSSDVYTKSETSGATEIATALNAKLDTTAYTPTDLSNYYQKSETSGATEIATALSGKQDTLSAGTNITIVDNVISATGGGEVSSAITSGDTNAVAGGAVYDKFDEVEQVTAAALNTLYGKFDEVEQVTAAALNTLYDNFDGLKLKKLTQSQYNALSPNYDANTLYVIVN